MSDLAQAALISGGIFVAVMARGYGRHVFDRRAIRFTVIPVAVFGYIYLRNMPTGTVGDWISYVIAVGLGLVFGGVAYAGTRLERESGSSRVHTITGPMFLGVWVLAVVLRLAFVWAITDWNWARMHVGEFMITHHIDVGAIAPFFLLWALTMVVSRLVALKVREQTLPLPLAA